MKILVLFLPVFLVFCDLAQSQNNIYYGNQYKYIQKYNDSLISNSNEFLYYNGEKEAFFYQFGEKQNPIKLSILEKNSKIFKVKNPNNNEIFYLELQGKGSKITWLSLNNENEVRIFEWNEPVCPPDIGDRRYLCVNPDNTIEMLRLTGFGHTLQNDIWYFSKKYPKGILLKSSNHIQSGEIGGEAREVSFPNDNKKYFLKMVGNNQTKEIYLLCINPDKSIQIFLAYQ